MPQAFHYSQCFPDSRTYGVSGPNVALGTMFPILSIVDEYLYGYSFNPL